MSEHPEIIVSVIAYPEHPEHVTRAIDALTRAAAGLALEGIDIDIEMRRYTVSEDETEDATDG